VPPAPSDEEGEVLSDRRCPFRRYSRLLCEYWAQHPGGQDFSPLCRFNDFLRFISPIGTWSLKRAFMAIEKEAVDSLLGLPFSHRVSVALPIKLPVTGRGGAGARLLAGRAVSLPPKGGEPRR